MSYQIVKGVEYSEDGKSVRLKWACNNVIPRTYRWSDWLKLDAQLLADIDGGSIQMPAHYKLARAAHKMALELAYTGLSPWFIYSRRETSRNDLLKTEGYCKEEAQAMAKQFGTAHAWLAESSDRFRSLLSSI